MLSAGVPGTTAQQQELPGHEASSNAPLDPRVLPRVGSELLFNRNIVSAPYISVPYIYLYFVYTRSSILHYYSIRETNLVNLVNLRLHDFS